ncbi:MAG: F420-dependent NADP oxidoreductase [Alphaproteobacteria bacterium]|nr:MAG: F420-dependent NADP oxidoreductase [Alphaproteobacteria bacterium]TMJ99906.1 MAG: F420-dependent NADP oxidoreductase [Alphaproteobacteria bacterium]TMK01276.1 MAG: F420-dependent NADP oxidoreductase [Alphaproteobacteria bacterium]
MRIAIIGAGSVGATLGQAWIRHGEDVTWGLRNPADPKYGSLPKQRVKRAEEAVKDAEVVVIATPWSATEAAIKSIGSLAGKIVIDCTNPLGMGPDGLQLVVGFNTSAGEQVASWARGAAVFKTLNTTGAGNMAKAADYPVKPVMLVAGDDAGKKPQIMELVGKLGFEPVDAGPLKNARLLEPFAMVWIDQAMKRGRGRDFAFALVNLR